MLLAGSVRGKSTGQWFGGEELLEVRVRGGEGARAGGLRLWPRLRLWRTGGLLVGVRG